MCAWWYQQAMRDALANIHQLAGALALAADSCSQSDPELGRSVRSSIVMDSSLGKQIKIKGGLVNSRIQSPVLTIETLTKIDLHCGASCK